MNRFGTDVGRWVAAICLLPSLAALPAAAQTPQKIWLESSLKRVWPTSLPEKESVHPLISGRNQRSSFQAVIRNDGPQDVTVECTVEADTELDVMVRRVGYVPMHHHTPNVDNDQQDGKTQIPGLVPDPLYPEQSARIGPFETQPFWISVKVKEQAAAGPHNLKVSFTSVDSKTKAKKLIGTTMQTVDVQPFTLQKRANFPVTHWWTADGIYSHYKFDQFDEQWWDMTAKYIQNMSEHGSNMIWIPLIHGRREVVEKPPQLLGVTETAPGRYQFDFSQAHRFVKMARENGMEYFEFPHLWLYWGVENPMHVYQKKDGKWSLLWPTETPATGDVYRNYLAQYLPALRQFLQDEGIDLDHAYFHLSDEPHKDHVENYRKARALLRELAPWMKVMDALTDVQYGKLGLTDIPVVQLRGDTSYREARIPHWVYYCTSPRGRYLNRFMDTPLDKLRMGGFLFYHLEAEGFLHWGYNYWYKIDTQQLLDVYQQTDSADWPSIPNGDPFVVYPGKDGPVDSIRWEVFAESLQDYTLLQMAKIKPDDPMFRQLKAYDDFSYSEQWIDEVTRKIVARIPASH